MTSVSVSIVLHNSAGDIAECLNALIDQTRHPDHVVVFDNASDDHGFALARRVYPLVHGIRSPTNIGFAAGQNRAIAAAPADFHLILNPDCQLAPEFLERSCDVLERDASAGAASGRLLRFRTDAVAGRQPPEELPDDILDSTGMVALRNRRVLDRGTDQAAAGNFLDEEYVFGASGAAALYRRSMLEQLMVQGQIFDEDFFAYREDVDLAWRAQLFGWKCRYVPGALARHRRRVAPGRRRMLPGWINRRSIANRWRMLAKNETADGWRRDWHVIAARDALTIAYCAVREPGSLAAALEVARSRRNLRVWRREVRRRQVVPDAYVTEWFGRRTAESIAPRDTMR